MRIVLCFILLFAAASSRAVDALRLWPHFPPGETTNFTIETNISQAGKDLVSGKPVIRLANVNAPTISIYLAPRDRRTGAAVVVCPGGGYNILAWDLEGTEICQWLNACGVTSILLKYRVPARPGEERYLAALQDAQRALSLTREHAAQWVIDTNRIGILGFSAGGHLSAAASCRFDSRAYTPIDQTDELSCRPNFAVLIYPAYLANQKQGTLSPELTVTSNTPPTFLVQTEDDPVGVDNSLVYYTALKNVHVPAELHLFPVGGHGYGLRASTNDVRAWPRLAEQWMRQEGLLHK